MTNFENAFAFVMGIEGNYANDPDDNGGETYCGISRRAHPDWKGWQIIDIAKKLKNFPESLYNNTGLKNEVKELYQQKYWNAIDGERWPLKLSTILFDIAVNCGVNTAIEYLQKTINLLNNNQKYYADIVVDSIYGSTTGSMLSVCQKTRPCNLICTVLRSYQAKHYIEIMEKQPSKEKYVGWFNRLTFINK